MTSIELWQRRPDTFVKAAWIIEVECLMREGVLVLEGQVRRGKLSWISRMKGVCTVKKSAYR